VVSFSPKLHQFTARLDSGSLSVVAPWQYAGEYADAPSQCEALSVDGQLQDVSAVAGWLAESQCGEQSLKEQ
jgi:hypothetical protein